MKYLFSTLIATMALALVGSQLQAQRPDGEGGRPPREGGRPEGRPGGDRGPRPGGDRGPGGPGGFPLMMALDANQDGDISAEEIKNAVKALKSLDKNKDGKLSPEEYRPQRGPGAGGPGRGGPGAGGGRPGGEGRPGEGRPGGQGRPGEGRPDGASGRPNPEEMVKRFMEADANKDGKISKSEAPERMKQGFDRIDADGDGFVTKDEIKKMFERFSQGGRPGGAQGRGGDAPSGEGVRPKRPAAE
ncbi:MAG: hypothetical protein COA78_29380 [Blastopirellula sp.]|nr:MAG: hypothetical protein COA78_29380 [Blastopirellula sp.]